MAKGESGIDVTSILVIGGVAYGAYWYLTNYGPAGPVTVPGGPGSYWAQWFGGSGNVAGALPMTATQGALAAGATQAPSPTNTRVTFQTSGGNNTHIAGGEQWQLNITGAAPNAPVQMIGTKTGNAAPIIWNAGVTDASGNFMTQGITDPANAGNWMEQWTVGGRLIATLTFSVYVATGQTPTAPATGVSGLGEHVPNPGPRSMSFHGAPMSGHGFQGSRRPQGQKSTANLTPNGGYIQ